MNTLKKTILVFFITMLAISGSIKAQVNPSINAEYTLEQIDEMYQKHRISHPRDIRPTKELSAQLQKDFPNARDIDWEKSDVFYRADFEIGRINSKDYKAYYDMAGKLVMYKEEISTRALPADVKNTLDKDYSGYRIEDAEKTVKGKQTFYKVELEKGDTEIELILSYNGKVIREEVDY